MFYYVSGPVAHMEANLAVIDCGGVGYACRTTSYTLSKLKQGEKAKLFTHLNTREDAMELFGFGTQEELNLFRQLISVSGVGPKAALSILSATTPANLALSIITGDGPAFRDALMQVQAREQLAIFVVADGAEKPLQQMMPENRQRWFSAPDTPAETLVEAAMLRL